MKTICHTNHRYSTGQTRSTFEIDFTDVHFTDEAIVQCNIFVIKILKQVVINWQLQNFNVNASHTVSETDFVYSFYFLQILKPVILFNHLMVILFNGLVVKVLDSQSRGPVFKTNGWLQGRLSLSSFLGRWNEYREFLGT